MRTNKTGAGLCVCERMNRAVRPCMKGCFGVGARVQLQMQTGGHPTPQWSGQLRMK